jgi:hypothetical protein
LDTGVSGGDQGPDEDPSEFRGYGPLDDQGNPTGQGEDQNSDHEDDQVVSQESPLEAHTRREKNLSPYSDEEAYPWKMLLEVFVKVSPQGGNFLTLALIMLLSLV